MGTLKSNCGSISGLQGSDSRGAGEGLPTLTVTTILVRLREQLELHFAFHIPPIPVQGCFGLALTVMSLLLAEFWGWLRGVEVPAVCSGHREGLGAVSVLWGGSQASLLSYT